MSHTTYAAIVTDFWSSPHFQGSPSVPQSRCPVCRTSIDDQAIAGVCVADLTAPQEEVSNVQRVLPAVPFQAPHKMMHPAVGFLTCHYACGDPVSSSQLLHHLPATFLFPHHTSLGTASTISQLPLKGSKVNLMASGLPHDCPCNPITTPPSLASSLVVKSWMEVTGMFMTLMTSESVSLLSRDTPVTFTGLQDLQEAGRQFCSIQLSSQCW